MLHSTLFYTTDILTTHNLMTMMYFQMNFTVFQRATKALFKVFPGL